MQSFLKTAVLAGFKIVESKENFRKEITPFEKSLKDIKYGRVTRIKNVSNLLEECKDNNLTLLLTNTGSHSYIFGW